MDFERPFPMSERCCHSLFSPVCDIRGLADFENYPSMIPVVRKATVHFSHVADEA